MNFRGEVLSIMVSETKITQKHIEHPPGFAGWVKARAAQMIVLINGVILTITAFLVLTLFIQGVLKEEYAQMGQDYVQTITFAANDLARDFTSLNEALKMSGNVPNAQKDLFEAIRRISPSFDQIFLFPSSVASTSTINGLISNVDPYPAYQTGLRALSSDMRVQILQKAQALTQDMVIISNLPQTSFAKIRENPLIEIRPFALMMPHKNLRSSQDVVVALTRMDRFIDLEWLTGKESIRSLEITAPQGEVLLKMERNDHGKVVGHRTSRNVLVGKQPLIVKLELWQSGKLEVLEQVPLFMLAFGAVLSLFGTLYVHNNQTQSLRLRSMNKALSQKNMELNSQVHQTDRLNHAIRKSEREHKAIIDSISDIIFETDTDGTIRFVNQTWSRTTGFERDRTIGLNLFDMLYPSDQEDQRRQFSMLVTGIGTAYRTITRLRTSDGTYHAVELAFSMLRKDENQQSRAVGTITDIEERRRAERALSEAEKKYRSIWENAPAGIYQISPDGQILLANPAMVSIFGYENTDQMMREVRNAHKTLFARQKDRQGIVQKLLDDGLIVNVESEAVRRDGVSIWVSESARAVKDDLGNIIYFEGSIENITDRKNAETALREAKISSDIASKVKSEFLANMSHELRTPLNAIIGFSEIIKNEVFGAIEQRSYWEYARDIHESGKRLLSVINDILDLSRIDAGERELNDSIIDLSKVVKVCVERAQSKADSQQQIIKIDLPENLPTLIAEEISVRQMLMNLMSNAIKFTPAGGRISVTAGLEVNGDFRLSVTDTGVGLEEEEIQRILQPFGRAEDAMTRSDSGAGLGLTLVIALMRLHSGHIDMISQKGVGTTVSLIFPAKRVQAQR